MNFSCAAVLALTMSLPLAAAPKTSLVASEGLQQPFGVTFDRDGNVYVVGMGNQVGVVRKDGRVEAVVGTGEKGPGCEDGPALGLRLNGPHHLLVGPDGHLYVADTGNNCVRRIDLRTGAATRVAGTGQKGFSGDGGHATAAQFAGIYAIAFHDGTLYMCDLGNRRVRAVDLATGIVRTVAGNGETGVPKDGEDTLTQPLVDPRAIAVDSKGNLYIVERNGHALRVVDPKGRIRTVAGTGEAGFSGDGGPALKAQLSGPKHVSVDRNDDVLITDTENHVIRRYSPRDGTIRRVMGTGVAGAAGLGGPPESCQLKRPHGAVVGPGGRGVYVSDSENNRVIRID